MSVFPRPLALLVVFLACAAGSAHAQVLPMPRGPDVKQEMREFNAEAMRGVSNMLAEWRGAWARHDVRGTARFYTEDALLQIGDTKPLQGRKAIEDSFAGTLATAGVIQVGVDDFSASGNLAYAYGQFWYQTEDGEETRPVSGSYVMVFRRDGRSWKIRSQMFSSKPVQQGEPASAETVGGETP